MKSMTEAVNTIRVRVFMKAIYETRGNVQAAATSLGVSRSYVYAIIRQHRTLINAVRHVRKIKKGTTVHTQAVEATRVSKVADALDRAGGDVDAAARLLGRSRTSVYAIIARTPNLVLMRERGKRLRKKKGG